MKKNTFTLEQLETLPAEEIIDKIQHENYSLLTSVGSDDLRKEMVKLAKPAILQLIIFSGLLVRKMIPKSILRLPAKS